jgi:hypothetical protein
MHADSVVVVRVVVLVLVVVVEVMVLAVEVVVFISGALVDGQSISSVPSAQSASPSHSQASA